MAFVGIALGLAGLLPFLGTSVGLWLTNDADFLRVGVLYAAVILSFLGGIQWGAALRGREGEGLRLVWSVIPSLLAWGGVIAGPLAGTLVIAGGVLLAWLYELQPAIARDLPVWYRRLRHLLTAGVLAALIADASWIVAQR